MERKQPNRQPLDIEADPSWTKTLEVIEAIQKSGHLLPVADALRLAGHEPGDSPVNVFAGLTIKIGAGHYVPASYLYERFGTLTRPIAKEFVLNFELEAKSFKATFIDTWLEAYKDSLPLGWLQALIMREPSVLVDAWSDL